MKFKGEVWMYYDEDSRKRRPGVVVGKSKDNDITIAKVTSHKARDKYDLEIIDWQMCGFVKPSTVRCSKLFTFKEPKLLYKVAYIEEEMDEIKQLISEYILEED